MSQNDHYTQGSNLRHDEAGFEIGSTDHEGGPSMADDQVFEPGPSFVEDDRPTDRLTDMPAWLQTFAASAIEKGEMPSGDEVPAPPQSAQPTQTQQDRAVADADVTLPDWLQDNSTETPSQHPQSARTAETFDDFRERSGTDAFISEDDLPDWLRVFSEESGQPAATKSQAPRVATVRSDLSVSAAVVRVPPVENVWLSAYERQALGPGPALFALLASNGSDLHSESAGPSHDRETNAMPPGGARTDRSGDIASPSSSQVSTDGGPETAPQRNSLRLLLVTLLVVLVIVALSAVFLS